MQSQKVVRENERLDIERKGEKGASFDVNLDLCDGPYIELRYLGKAADHTQPPTYESAVILGAHRVRGVGYNAVGRNNLRAKQRIPAGWHENRCDPNLPTTNPEYNCHKPLPEFAPTDFGSFVMKCAEIWAIDLQTEEVLL